MSDERIDLYDKGEKFIRTVARKGLYKPGCRREGEYIKFASMFLVNAEGKILVPTRSSDKELFPNCYDFSCAEHLQTGEDYDEAIRRGVQEELGIQPEHFQRLGKITEDTGIPRHTVFYKAEFDGDVKFDRGEFVKVEWLSLETLEELIRSNPEKFKNDLVSMFQRFREKLK